MDPVFFHREISNHLSFSPRALQTAVARIALISTALQRNFDPNTSTSSVSTLSHPNLPSGTGAQPDDFPYDLGLIRTYTAHLNNWVSTLPPNLQLSALLTCDTIPVLTDSQRSSMLLAHSVYLSVVMQLTRNVFLRVVKDPSGGYYRCPAGQSLSPEQTEALGYVGDCLLAARMLGSVIGLMLDEGKLLPKWWMAVYNSFNASLLLLFHTTQIRLARGMGIGVGVGVESMLERILPEDDALGAARKCISALEFTAKEDRLSGWYLKMLEPFRRGLGRGRQGLSPISFGACPSDPEPQYQEYQQLQHQQSHQQPQQQQQEQQLHHNLQHHNQQQQQHQQQQQQQHKQQYRPAPVPVQPHAVPAKRSASTLQHPKTWPPTTGPHPLQPSPSAVAVRTYSTPPNLKQPRQFTLSLPALQQKRAERQSTQSASSPAQLSRASTAGTTPPVTTPPTMPGQTAATTLRRKSLDSNIQKSNSIYDMLLGGDSGERFCDDSNGEESGRAGKRVKTVNVGQKALLLSSSSPSLSSSTIERREMVTAAGKRNKPEPEPPKDEDEEALRELLSRVC